MDSVILNSSRTQWSHDRESDDSEDDDILPTEEYWAIPDDGWTLVEKPHGKPRGVRMGYRRCSGDLDGKLDNKGLGYDELDDIVDTTVLSNYQKKVVQITDTFVETSSDTRTVIVDVKPIVNEQPDRLVVISMDKTDGRADCLMNMVLAPRGRESEYDDVRTQPVELLPESRVVVQNEMAEEVTTGGLTDSGDIITGMTEMGAIADDEVVMRPVPRLLDVEVMEETEAVEISLVEYIDGQLVKNETTKPGVSTELVYLPQKWITRGFLELAEEARLVDVRLTPSCCMNESVQRITEIKELMSRDISWKIEEVMERSVDSFSDVATRMPTVKFDIGQLMQWPNGKSTGMMICEYTLKSQMFSHGPVWREAEPVFMAAESEVFTPVFTGEFVVETDPLVMAEAVTSRVSALPTVGSDIQTGLSTAVGREDRCSLSSGNILDKVGHVAGRLEARTVPVEDLLLFSAVYFVMPSWIRSLTIQTSKFFLSDEREEVGMPLYARDDRPVRTRRLYIHDVDMRAQMTKETHGVGPNGDRWDGIDMIDEWYMGCIWMKTQPGDTERLLRGNTCSGNFGLETGPAARTGLSVFDLDWLDGHPNRRGGSVETETDVTIAQYDKDIKSSLSRDGTLSDQPAVWKCAPVYPLILVTGSDRTLTVLYCGVVSKSLAVRLEMSSGSFLKSVSESNQDKLYDLPEGIQDVMGLQALRPSPVVCKVMSIPDSNCIRIM